jgi:hypothetical protein
VIGCVSRISVLDGRRPAVCQHVGDLGLDF